MQPAGALQPAPGGPAAQVGPVAIGQPGQQPAPQKPRRRVLTSLGFQIFIYFGGWWDLAYYILNILVFVYKGLQLPYPTRNFALEFSFAFLWILIEVPRLFLASKGNKTERAMPIIFSFILALPLVGMYVYYVAFQTFVLKVDRLMNAVALIFVGIQFVFGLLAIIRFILATRFA
ncbi:Transmembrane protein 216 [Tetrabaena socialis]|uniref:Transmembrane protein 216 n=1 Tax=Tetrabaena socialis TaxID=47790 RepID=A0A2J7ZW47_9CHLO|nr:Transmembrane protein 216 [Tetrabaena socialis]|eukprot:PNH04499.1 Transmembrane protein 216 [Tetrabaena socialis]